MTKLINNLKESLGSLKSHTEALRSGLSVIRDKIIRLEAEQATILDRPLCKSDLLEIFLSRLDCAANAGDERWGAYFIRQAEDRYLGRTLRNSVRSIRALRNGEVASMEDTFLSYGEVLPPGRMLAAEVVFSLFRDPIKEAVRRAFDKVEWPFPDAEPGETYFLRLDEIEAELADLRSQEELLVDGSGELGIPLPKPLEDRYSR